MTKLSRDAQLKRAAEIRAAVIAQCNASHKSMKCSELYQAIDTKGMSPDSFRRLVKILAENGLVQTVRHGDNEPVEYYNMVFSENQHATPQYVRSVVAAQVESETLKIDLIKDSGRVRIQIQGLVIEVGVV